MYATASDLLVWFDAQEIAQLATPKRYSVVDAVLLELTAAGGDRSAYSAPQIEAADAALAVINDALSAASLSIDSYVRERYTLPLAQGVIDASPLARTCADIARFELNPNQEIEAVTKRHDKALRWLRDLATGVVSLGAGDPVPAASGGVVVSGPERMFGRDRTGVL